MTVSIYIGLLLFIGLILSVRVTLWRHGMKISIGDGNDKLMARRVRAFGNFSEYAPLMIAALVVIELSNFSMAWLHFLGVLAVLGRAAHGMCFLENISASRHFLLRRIGMASTYTMLCISAILFLLGNAIT